MPGMHIQQALKEKSGAKLLIICRIRASFGVGITVPVVIDIIPFTSMPPTVDRCEENTIIQIYHAWILWDVFQCE
jgi:hypothetical protein